MPVFNPKLPSPTAPAKPPVQIAKPSYASVAVDTRYEPKETLLSHVEGAPWTLKSYFSQVLNRDSGTAGQGMGTDPVNQQYKMIVNMEVRITAPLSETQDTTTGEMMVTGTATLFPFIIPNKGDMFIANLLDGRPGVFQITNSERLAVMRDTVHSVDFKLVAVGDVPRMQDLESKVVQTVYFERDFIYMGKNPLLVPEDYEHLQFLRRQYSTLVVRYFKRFYSREYATLIVPDQGQVTYDSFLVRALYGMLETGQAPELLTLRNLNVNDDQVMQADSLWTMLLNRDGSWLDHIFQKVGVVGARSFTRNPVFEGVAYSGIQQVIYPMDAIVRVDNQVIEPPKPAAPLILYHEPYTSRRMAQVQKALQPGEPDPTLELIKHHACSDGYYIFSQAFYEDNREAGAQSFLELKVQDFLAERAIPYADLVQLVEASVNWNNVDTYYYIPILILLIKSAIVSQ